MITNSKFNNAQKVRNEIGKVIKFIKNNEFNLSKDDIDTMANFLEYGVVVLNKSIENSIKKREFLKVVK